MVLSSGMRVGPYEIEGFLGAGAMGEVYRARDPRLGREVAVKILRADIGDRRRFETEARAAGSLNHPNILSVYDIGEESGTPYIVAELLEGDSLRALMGDGPVQLGTLLDIAVQIAAGLAAAHARDITHRDLKPENIMVLGDGQVRILDFGLAKPGPPEEPAWDHDTRTSQGVLVGTLAYMSPEQLQGRVVDFRSDQFAFGTIVYEMATGSHPFERGDRVSTMSALAHEDAPPLTLLNPLIPAPLRWVIDRCLAKDPSRRYSSTADLCRHLQDIRDHLSEILSTDPGTALPDQTRRRGAAAIWALGAAAIAIVLIAGFAAGAIGMRRHAAAFAFQFTPFATEVFDETEPSWSADGQTIVYSAEVNGVYQIFARKLDAAVPVQITKAPSPCRHPFWSPDSARIYYWSAAGLWSVGAAGGEPVSLISPVSVAGPAATVSPTERRWRSFNPRAAPCCQLMSLTDRKIRTYYHVFFQEGSASAAGSDSLRTEQNYWSGRYRTWIVERNFWYCPI